MPSTMKSKKSWKEERRGRWRLFNYKLSTELNLSIKNIIVNKMKELPNHLLGIKYIKKMILT
jgi:hypothetical protein